MMKIDGTRLKFREVPDKRLGDTTVQVWRTKLPKKVIRCNGIGVDPGRNFGIASIRNAEAWVLVGKMRKAEAQWHYGLEGYDILAGSTPILFPELVVVEGGFGNVPGAVNLAYTRMGFVLGAFYMGKTVDIVPPNKIRKTVLGYGKVNTDVLDNLWGLPPHGSDAFVCACYAAGVSLTVPKEVHG